MNQLQRCLYQFIFIDNKLLLKANINSLKLIEIKVSATYLFKNIILYRSI